MISVFENNGDKDYIVTNAGSAGTRSAGDGKKFTINDTTVPLTLAAAAFFLMKQIECK